MSTKFNPFIGNLDFTGSSGGGGGSMSIGGSVTGSTANSLLTIDGTGNLDQKGPLTNGQLLIGRTGNSAIPATLTGTANRVTVTNASGSITLSGPQDIATTSSPTFVSLTLNNGSLRIDAGGANYTESSYIAPTTLTANASTVGLSYLASASDGCIINYSMRQNGTNNVRTGIIYVANNSTVSSLSDNYTETANVEIFPSVSLSGGNVEVSFLNTNLSNNVSFKAEIKQFK